MRMFCKQKVTSQSGKYPQHKETEDWNCCNFILERWRIQWFSLTRTCGGIKLLSLEFWLYNSLLAVQFGEGNGTPLQYSCLENPMDRGAWWAAVHGVAKSRTRLSDFTVTFHFHALEKEMATHSSVLAWRIPGTGEPGGLPAVYGVTPSWTRLKRLSSSSCTVWGKFPSLSKLRLFFSFFIHIIGS